MREWKLVGPWLFSAPYAIGPELKSVGSRTVVDFVLYKNNRVVSRHGSLPSAKAAAEETHEAKRNGPRKRPVRRR